MSYETVLADLKRLNRQELIAIPPDEHLAHMAREGDRSTIILLAASIEAAILYVLKEHMPTLNSEESDRIFNFEGPCGSFSNRVRLAQGLGLIDRQTRKNIELIKEMRNAAAHSFLTVNFETPQIRAAVALLFPSGGRETVLALDHAKLRSLFTTVALWIGRAIAHQTPTDFSSLVAHQANKAKPPTSPEK